MRKTHVLIIDDSVLARRAFADLLADDPTLEVNAIAGADVLGNMPRLRPDLVTLDVDTGDREGLRMLREIHRWYPTLPMIALSTRNERGAHAAFDALALGAVDWIAKPAPDDDLTAGMEALRAAWIPKIKAYAGRDADDAASRQFTPLVVPAHTQAALPIDVMAIEAATAAPRVLATVLRELPANWPVPVVVMQPMPAVFAKILGERLGADCALPVEVAGNRATLVAGVVLLVPGDVRFSLEEQASDVLLRAAIDPPPARNGGAAPSLLAALAERFGSRLLTVLLGELARDATPAYESARRAGAQIIADDDAARALWGTTAVTPALADRVLPLGDVGRELQRRIGGPRTATPNDGPTRASASR